MNHSSRDLPLDESVPVGRDVVENFRVGSETDEPDLSGEINGVHAGTRLRIDGHEPDFLARRMPGEAVDEDEASRELRALAARVDDVDPARRTVTFDQSDLRAVGRDARVANERRLVEALADGKLQDQFPSELAHDSQTLSVQRPVSGKDILQDLSWCPARHRDASERSGSDHPEEVGLLHQDSELS